MPTRPSGAYTCHPSQRQSQYGSGGARAPYFSTPFPQRSRRRSPPAAGLRCWLPATNPCPRRRTLSRSADRRSRLTRRSRVAQSPHRSRAVNLLKRRATFRPFRASSSASSSVTSSSAERPKLGLGSLPSSSRLKLALTEAEPGGGGVPTP